MKQPAPPPRSAISESIRERETFRYHHQLDPSNYVHIRDGNLPSGAKLATASDSVLTGLAQLGALQTNTAKGFISLFDSSHQFIVAEASSSMRIATNLPSDDLVLCGAAIPRSQGTCDHVLSLAWGPSAGANGYELPVSVVPNLADDSRFTCRPYCQFPEGGQFYAGVPIRTRKGINIGSYCVMSAAVPPGWDEEHVQRLRDISCAIMTHLEFRKSSYDNQRHERFTSGLSSFIEGKDVADVNISPITPGREQRSYGIPGHPIEQRGDTFPEVGTPVLSSVPAQISNTRPLMPSAVDPRTPSSINGIASAGPFPTPSTPQAPPSRRGPAQIFSNAAQVLRNTFAAAGCVFFDTALSLYDKHPEYSQDTAGFRRNDPALNGVYSTSSSDEYFGKSHRETVGGNCDVLGVATAGSTETNDYFGQAPQNNICSLPRTFLARLLKMYPNGKIFNFDASGELHSNESSEDSGLTLSEEDDKNGMEPTPNARRRRARPRRHDDIEFVQKAFPGARSVMFVPVWDPKRERWFAGGFLYSVVATRFFTSHEDMSLVVAFSKIIGAEILNMEVFQTEKAKSDALGSLSHELRSPLHGIILGTEILNDTDLTVYQGNATHIIETCCRTLLDTINHLLDFSKVNNVTHRAKSQLSPPTRPGRLGSGPSFFGKQYMRNSLRLDGLVEDVVVSVVAGHNFEQLFAEQLGPTNNSRGSVSKEVTPPETEPSENWPGVFEPLKEAKGEVAVYVTADPGCNWLLDLQPGPMRRIVMNLVGNSLKHTAQGTVHVRLSQESSRRSLSSKAIQLTVSDTGGGISDDFLQNSLFQPFSQEDALSPGIGLGLSLVKKMVTQMRGRIKVQSQLGVGTTVQVTLPHSPPLQPTDGQIGSSSDEDDLFEKQRHGLSGLRVAIQGFGSDWGGEGRGLVETICCGWLNLCLVNADQPHPDVVLLSEDHLAKSDDGHNSLQSHTPMIVVCRSAPSTWRFQKAYRAFEAQRIVEFVSQPIAPRIFAKAILAAYQRWTDLSELVLVPRPATLKRAHSVGSGQFSLLSTPNLEPIVDNTSPSAAKVDSQVPGQEPSQPAAAAPGGFGVPEKVPVSTDILTPAVPAQKLLLVDDNNINLKVLSAIVTRLGHSYQTATNGQEAVDAYVQDAAHFSAVLMDISMPIMDGLEATRRIRHHERTQDLPTTPVLALTGLSSDDTHKEALKSGVDVFLTKPVRFPTLRDALASVGLHISD